MKNKWFFILPAGLGLVLLSAGQAWAQADTDFVSRLVDEFYTKTSAWEPILYGYALTIFRWLLILEVCWLGVKAALNRDNVADIFRQFVMLLLMAGFFMAVLANYQTWAWQLINGLKAIGLELSPNAYSSDSPFLTGMSMVKVILDKLSFWSPGNSVALIIAALVIIVCFALISAQVVLIKCEAMISMAAAMLLVAFGATSFLKEYAINAVRYVLSVAFKLFVLQLVLGIGINFIEGFSTATAELADIFVVIGASVVLLALVKTIPDICAGIINGSHVSASSGLPAAAGAVSGAVAGAAITTVNTGRNISDAAKIASEEGSTGLGRLNNMARSMWGASQDAKFGGEKNHASRVHSEMQERLAQVRMTNLKSKDE